MRGKQCKVNLKSKKFQKPHSKLFVLNGVLLKVSLKPLGNRKVCTPKKTGRSQTVFRANRQNVRRQRSCSRSEFVNLLQSENALTVMRQAKPDLRSKFPDQEGLSWCGVKPHNLLYFKTPFSSNSIFTSSSRSSTLSLISL